VEAFCIAVDPTGEYIWLVGWRFTVPAPGHVHDTVLVSSAPKSTIGKRKKKKEKKKKNKKKSITRYARFVEGERLRIGIPSME
jgi:hypothetical protein